MKRPTFSFMLQQPAHWLALGFGSGLAPKAPGTFGTLWAWATFVLMQIMGLPLNALWLLALLSIPVGWWACTRTAENMGIPDPGSIVWDEICAFWLILCFVEQALQPSLLSPYYWALQAIAFALFRFFDAAKPQPVRWADRAFKGTGWRGGWGIMVDDLVAALCSVAVLLLFKVLGWDHALAGMLASAH